jgi:hypothetical protein
METDKRSGDSRQGHGIEIRSHGTSWKGYRGRCSNCCPEATVDKEGDCHLGLGRRSGTMCFNPSHRTLPLTCWCSISAIISALATPSSLSWADVLWNVLAWPLAKRSCSTPGRTRHWEVAKGRGSSLLGVNDSLSPAVLPLVLLFLPPLAHSRQGLDLGAMLLCCC